MRLLSDTKFVHGYCILDESRAKEKETEMQENTELVVAWWDARTWWKIWLS